MKNKFKSYGFWTALAGAVVMLLNTLGQAFGFSIDDKIVTDIIMSIAGILVVFGIVAMPQGESSQKNDENELKDDKNIELKDKNDSEETLSDKNEK